VLFLPGIGHEEEAVAVGTPEIAGVMAARGLMSLSIDFAGNGQSPEDLAQPDITKIWCRQIVKAIEYLRHNGAEKIAVIAPRLAGALAIVAAKDARVDALVLWSPVLSGRRYQRELKMMQGTGAVDPLTKKGDISIGGFTLPAIVVESIARLEIADVATAPAPEVLYIEGTGRVVDDRTVGHLRELGSNVEIRTGADTIQWLFTPSDGASVPFESARGIADWIDDRFGDSALPQPIDVGSLPTATSLSFSGKEIRESFVSVGELGLSGVMVEPVEPDPELAAVLYLSMGPGRSFVREARRAARDGRRALRVDFAGFGLSPMRATQSEPELYGATGGDDVQLGVAHLLARGASSVVIVGFCAGAWASITCPPIKGVCGIASINVHLSVRVRKFAERSKNNQVWQRELRRSSKRTLLTKVRNRLNRLFLSAQPPVRWLTALGNAGISVGLYFDPHDLGLQYWLKNVSRHFRRQVEQGTIEVRVYPELGHLVEGATARSSVFEDIHKFMRRCDVQKPIPHH